jgi:hypothetical protein
LSVEKVADYEFASLAGGVHYDWFVDRVIGYLQSRSPETPPRFLWTTFLTMVSAPLSARTHLSASAQNVVPLTLYSHCLGASTLSRKTTAQSLVRSFFDDCVEAFHWDSSQYLAAVQEVDSALRMLFRRLESLEKRSGRVDIDEYREERDDINNSIIKFEADRKDLLNSIGNSPCERSLMANVLFGSNVTAEGLNFRMAQRPGGASIMFVDELQNMYSASQGEGYRSGLIGFLTDVYSGRTVESVRVGNDGVRRADSERVPHSLAFCGTGILGDVVDNMTQSLFETGWGPRILFALDEENRQSDPSSFGWVTNNTLGAHGGDGFVEYASERISTMLGMIQHEFHGTVTCATEFWPVNTPMTMTVTESARNVWVETMRAWSREAARESPFQRAVQAVVDRMGNHIMRAAAILSLFEQQMSVPSSAVRKAFSLAADFWLPDALKMIDYVFVPDLTRMVDDFSSNPPTETRLYQVLEAKNLSPRSVEEYRQYILRRGVKFRTEGAIVDNDLVEAILRDQIAEPSYSE